MATIDYAPGLPRRADARMPFTVALEGIDGTGKSMLTAGLLAHLAARGHPSGRYAYYGNELAGDIIDRYSDHGLRTVPLCTALFALGFHREVWRAATSGNAVAVFDRHKFTGLVKDRMFGGDATVSRQNYALVPDPEVVAWIDLDPEVALARIRAARGLSWWELGEAFLAGDDYLAARQRFRDGAMSVAEQDASFVRARARERELFAGVLAAVPHMRLDGTLPFADLLARIAAAFDDALGH